MAEATARTSRWWVFRPPDSAGGIYGTIATMAVIAGAARGSSHGRVLALAVGTVAVFWLAHVYAHAPPAGPWNRAAIQRLSCAADRNLTR